MERKSDVLAVHQDIDQGMEGSQSRIVAAGTDQVKSLDVVYGPLRDSSSVSQAVKAGATSSVSLLAALAHLSVRE
ncbi:hypothetical protein, partial [Rhodococcus chondri]